MKQIKIWIGALVILLLITSNIYSQNVVSQSREKYNPEYHFYPSIDPTGLFYFDGRYFLNWGSAWSKDFVHWKMTEYGKARNNFSGRMLSSNTNRQNLPQQSIDSLMRSQVISGMSGSVVVDRNNSSGLGENGNPPLIALNMSSRSTFIAYSNDTAKSWIRYEKPAAISNSSGTFRDPKVFWYEPDKKWILVMGWANIQKVKFFSSNNLKDWEYMSEFGPWGAVAGEWECVDFFPLAVDGNPSNIKWVLEISLQPCNGEYFIGDFDGKRFTLDQSFINELKYDKYMPSGKMLFDFERGIDDWKMEGDAFIECPSDAEGVLGREGKYYINSAHRGLLSKGKITSPEFTISKDYIDFLVGGGYYPGDECVNLLVEGKIVRTQTGNSNSTNMIWTGWDVSEFMGKKGRIEIVDNMAEGMGIASRGFIYCDAIMLSDELPHYKYNTGWEKAFWVDWGPDYYALRSWNSYAPDEKRVIWVGWMGIWRYTFTEPQMGLFSVPRNIELKSFPEGIRLIQTPIKELESLRTSHKVAEGNTFEGIWNPQKFLPSKNAYELIVEFENISAEEFGLNICVSGNEKTVVGYNVSKEELYVDRRHSGYDEFSPVFPCIAKGPLKNRTKTTKMHIFIDKCSVEVFGNNGETTISAKIYPDPSSTGITLFSNNGKVKVKSLELWDLGPINLY